MFGLFKKSNAAVIEQIHNEFNNAGDALLKQAKEIIAGITIENSEKINRLQRLGFSASKEVETTENARKEKRLNQEFAEAMDYFIINFPKYKFITEEVAEKICKKYNLFIGNAGQYKGFVPDKNLKQIEDFYLQDNELTHGYFDESNLGRSREVTKREYDRQQERRNDLASYSDLLRQQQSQVSVLMAQANSQSSYISKRKRDLKIAAPIKDMDTRGYEVKGRHLVREVPDPVVLVPIERNNHKFYCIVTAWGDEASDEMVVNEIKN